MAGTAVKKQSTHRRRELNAATQRISLLEDLESKFDDLERRFARLSGAHADLQRRYDALQIKSTKQEQQIRELEEALAKARKTSRNSSKPPSSDIVKPPKAGAASSDSAEGRRKRGGQPGHPRHERPDVSPD